MKVQYVDKTIDVPVVMQRQVLASQTVQKTVEVPQVEFLDRVVDVSLVMQRHLPCPSMPGERVQERIVEENIDVHIAQMMEKTIEVMKPIPQERVQNNTVEQIVDMPIPQIQERPVEVRTEELRFKFEAGDKEKTEELRFKCEAGDKENTEEAVQHACDWLDKNMLTENDEFEAQQKELEGTDRLINVPVAIQHQRFKDLVLPSSQSCLCVSIASSDEGGDEAGDGSTEGWTEMKKRGRKKPTKKSASSSDLEEEELKQQAEATSLVQGETAGVRKTKLTRKAQEVSWSKWRQTWRQVAHTSRPQWTRSGPKSYARSVGWSSFWCNGKENSTSRRTWRSEGWRGWKERALS